MKSRHLFAKISLLSYVFTTSLLPVLQVANNDILIKRAESLENITLNVYNWEDYMAIDSEDQSVDIPTLFHDYMLKKGKNVTIKYSTFDTNETMLSQLKIGSVSYDLICPSDYVIQKMIAEDLIVPFADTSTPDYEQNVSPFIKDKISSIKIDGKKNIVSSYCRPYMWGTLGILYNDNYSALKSRGIDSKTMRSDLTSWLSLWDDKYDNLLAIKDSMRDSYAVGILKAYYEDFTLNDVKYEGFKTLKEKHDAKLLTDEEYNLKLTNIFNLCDDETLNDVLNELKSLKKHAFGFEVDSGKIDMAKGDKFAINIAWSGDAVFAMNQADEFSASLNKDSEKTILKYSLPDTGANIWFDGWVIPKTSQNKNLAEEFVNFLSLPDIAQLNMDYIGYTPVIAGDDILSSLKANYDIRYDSEGNYHEEYLTGKKEVKIEDIESLSDEEKDNSYFIKDVSYFFNNTISEESDSVFYISASDRYRQFDAQYPDSNILPSLCIMNDFGKQNDSMLKMWEKVKNNNLPLWSYYLILIVVILIIGFIIFIANNNHQKKKRRKQRKMERILKENKSIELFKTLTENLLPNQ